jgi:hypothetical protein
MKTAVIANVVIPFVIFIALAMWNTHEAGTKAVTQGLDLAGKQLVGVMIVIVIAFAITGQVQVLFKRHEPAVLEFLNGKNGVWGAVAAGMVTPSMSAFPIVEKMWAAGQVPLAVIIPVIIASRLLNLQMMLFFLPFLGMELMLITSAAGVVLLVATVFTMMGLSKVVAEYQLAT